METDRRPRPTGREAGLVAPEGRARVPRPRRDARKFGHVVVLGSGLAGLAAAAAAAPHAAQVTVLERDPLTDPTAARTGVPQSRHVHLLLPGGVIALEHLLPGIQHDLDRAGAQLLREPHDFAVYLGGGRVDTSRANPRFVLVGATRPLIERVVRERVQALGNVRVCAGREAIGLLVGAPGTVAGVRVRQATGDPEEIRADLVIDASGSNSRALAWLADLGVAPPPEERVRVDVRYATRLFAGVRSAPGSPRNVMVGSLPDDERAAVALAVEDDRWIVTLTTMHGERPPTDLDAFRAFARSLWSPAVDRLIADAEPVGEAAAGGFASDVRRHWHRWRAAPRRFVALGDALGCTNPRYALGMSMAMREASVLRSTLAHVGPDHAGRAFFRATKALLSEAYTQAVDKDLACRAVDGPRTVRWRVVSAYARRLLARAHHDPVVGRALFDVMGALAPSASLLRPSVAWRVSRQAAPGPSRARAHPVEPSEPLVP